MLPTSQEQSERLMCEVEFWEVFYGKNEGFFMQWCLMNIHWLTAE
jgi:hypothetical protein